MVRVIINADDFGINPKVTEETIFLLKNNSISSATIMANGTCLGQAAEFSKSHPEFSFGVHVCLDEFDSLTKNTILQKYGITDNVSVFIKGSLFNISYFDQELIKAIDGEIRAQVDQVLSLGVSISHIDSHHLAKCYDNTKHTSTQLMIGNLQTWSLYQYAIYGTIFS